MEIRNIEINEEGLPTEIAYADDVDFISLIKHKDITKVSEILKTFNLLVNNDKTEHTTLSRKKSRQEEEWRKVKKVGSLLGDEEDIERRKQLATVAMNKLQPIWIKNQVNQKTKMKLYRALVKSILLYNM